MGMFWLVNKSLGQLEMIYMLEIKTEFWSRLSFEIYLKIEFYCCFLAAEKPWK